MAALQLHINPPEHGVGTGIFYHIFPYGSRRQLRFQYQDFAGEIFLLLGLDVLLFDDIEPFVNKRVVADSSRSHESFELARDWLQTCRSTHFTCSEPKTTTHQLPTRLISIGKQNYQTIAQLCEGKNLPLETLYLTLSHCWGREPIFSLALKNLEDLKGNIHILDLPKVFQDAMYMTEQLGFMYLWIDSLYIVQDSTSDWLKEASRMGEVYKNAACNLAATGFSNGQNGLFVSRNANTILPQKALVECSALSPLGNEKLIDHCLIEADLWKSGVDNAPLNRRAWVVQERIMSPRILHFGSKQLFWECFETNRCETFPRGIPLHLDAGLSFKQTASLSQRPASNVQATMEGGRDITNTEEQSPRKIIAKRNELVSFLYAVWCNIVAVHSAGALTYAEDKLVALSGIAKQMQGLLQDEYLAGMWKANLLNELLWKVSPVCEDVGLTLEYRAPTWSWASIDGVVECSNSHLLIHDGQVLHSRVLQANTTLCNEDQTGPVKGGYLRIVGPLAEARKSVSEPWEKELWSVSDKSVEVKVDYDMPTPYEWVRRDMTSVKFSESGRANVRVGTNLIPYLYGNNRSLFFMPIQTYKKHFQSKSEMSGLILFPTNRNRGEFMRIGVFEVGDPESQRVLQGPLDRIEEKYYEAFDGVSQYTITIV